MNLHRLAATFVAFILLSPGPFGMGLAEVPPRFQESLLALHAIIRPRAGEAPWTEIPWQTDLQAARKQAAAEGKPLFVWSASADPLGCT
jgi:hypothetical protein